MPDNLPNYQMTAAKPLAFRASIGGGLAICIGFLLLSFDPSPADRMAAVFLGVGLFFVVVGLAAPRLSHD